MLKGKEVASDFSSKQAPLPTSEKNQSFPGQDSLPLSVNQDSTPKPKIILNNSATYSQHQLDSLFSVSERRERQILNKPKPVVAQTDTVKLVTDTLSVKYSTYNFPFSEPKAIKETFQDFILPLPFGTRQINQEPVQHANKSIADSTLQHSTVSVKAAEPTMFKGNERNYTDLSWLTVIIVVSLFIFSFIKNTYNKFIVQVVSGLIDYQIAMRLYRERNVLFRNVSLGLHAVFYINSGLFIYFMMETFQYTQLYPDTFRNILVYSLGVFLIYNIKSIVNKIIGYVFLVQEEFSEYIHNVNLFNKNIGLFLFPIIILYPFIIEKFKPFIVYTGLVVFSIVLLLRFYRGFQIIMRKGVSPFYLILYLCAIEILPVLLLVKFTSTLI